MSKFTLTAAADKILNNQDLVKFIEEKAKSTSQPEITAKDVLTTIKGATQLPRTILQETAKSGGSIGLTLMGKDQLTSEELSPDLRAAKDIIFGKDPVKSLQTRIAESEIDIQRKIQSTIGEKTAKGVSPFLAGAVVLGTVALDFTGAGGQKTAIKTLTKLNKVDDIGKVLKDIGVADDLIKEYAPILAKTSKAEDVSKIVNRLGELQKTTKISETGTKTIDPLIQEARKYKSAEELPELFFHATNKPDEILSSGYIKSGWGKGNFSKGDVFIEPPTGNEIQVVFGTTRKNVASEGKNGFGGYKITSNLNDLPLSETRIFLRNSKGEMLEVTDAYRAGTKTKSQLTDIWNKAQGVNIAETSAEMTKVVDKAKGFNWTQRGFLENVAKNRPDIPLKSGGQYVPRSTDKLAIKARTIIKEDINVAEQLAKEATDAGTATTAELLKHYDDLARTARTTTEANALWEKAAELAHFKAVQLTEMGRGIQAATIMGRLTPEGILRFASREINKYNEAIDSSKKIFKAKKIPGLTPEQTKELMAEAKKLQAMEDGFDKMVAFKKLNDKISDLVPTPFWKKMIGVWKAGLLTGIKTTGLNTLSNLFHGVSEGIKDIPAAAIDSVTSLFTGKRTLALTGKGATKGTIEGFKKGWRFLKTGVDERDVLTKLDYRKISFGKGKFAKTIQGYEETIFKLMGAEDQPFYYAAKARSLQSQAIAQAKNLKLKGKEAKTFIEKLVANPTDEMLKYSVGDAEMAVFQNKTGLGTAAKKLQEIPGGEFVVPFSKTPSAVATQLINYSPVGIVKTIVQNIGKGRFDQRLFAQGLGRGLTGTGIMYIGTELAKKGLINTKYPETEREQKLWEAEGRQPNAININGKWRNVNTLGPAGNALLVGAYYYEGLKKTGSPLQAMSQGVIGGLSSLKEQTFLSGINQVVEALDDPERFATGYFSSTLSSFIPTIIGDISKATDPLERKTTAIPDKLKAKIPWLRQTLEPKVNILGEEILTKGNPLEIMIDPSRPSEELSSEVVSEFRRLYDAGYKISPTQLGTKTGYNSLTPEENTLLWKKAGELMQSKLTNLFKSEEYKKLPDDKKAEIVQKFIEKSNTIARAEMVMALTEGLSGQELKTKLSELKTSGLMTRDVFSQYLEWQ